MMEFSWMTNNNSMIHFIINLSLTVLLFGWLFFVFFKVCRRKSAFIFLGVSAVSMILCIIFELFYFAIAVGGAFAACMAVSLFANLGDLRSFIGNPFKRVTAKAANFGVEKIFNREELYNKVKDTVIALSKSRTGALITFEKNTSLKDIIKNGVPINAPVSQELLQTIFYEGTRLHDGAVIIHGDQIVAASVFFTPTTKPFAGKYGSRHRAAIGISEISDSVTVVVSEETGRISIAVDGELNTVDQDNFLRAFETYMAQSSESEEE